MKKYKLPILFLSFVVVIWIVIEVLRPQPLSWDPTFINTDKNPYGTYIVYENLESIFPDQKKEVARKPVYNSLENKTSEAYSYISICNEYSMDNADWKRLKSFLNYGNCAFIAAERFSNTLADSVGFDLNSLFSDVIKADTVYQFTHPALKNQRYPIHSFGRGYFVVEDSAKQIHSIMENKAGKPVLICVKVGRGALYLCSLPYMFTNLEILENGRNAAAFKALSYLPAEFPVVWDEYQTQGPLQEDNMLRVFHSKTSLRLALFTALLALLTIFVVGTRRKVRMQKLIIPLRNSSLDFIRVVALLHQQQKNYADISRKKATYFYERVRSNYYLSTHNRNAEFCKALSEKSGIPPQEIEKLVAITSEALDNPPNSETFMIRVNRTIEEFYSKTKLKL